MRNQSNKRIAKVHHYNNFYFSQLGYFKSKENCKYAKNNVCLPLPHSASKYQPLQHCTKMKEDVIFLVSSRDKTFEMCREMLNR